MGREDLVVFSADETVTKMRQNCFACRRVPIDLGEEIVLIYLPCESPPLLLAAFLCCECKAWN